MKDRHETYINFLKLQLSLACEELPQFLILNRQFGVPEKYVLLLYKLYFKRTGMKIRRLIRCYYRNSGRTDKTVRRGDLSCIQNSLHILPTSLVLLSFLTQIRFHSVNVDIGLTTAFLFRLRAVVFHYVVLLTTSLKLLYCLRNAGSSSFPLTVYFCFLLLLQ